MTQTPRAFQTAPSTTVGRRRHTVQGLVPILATPFLPDGSLDRASLRRLVEFQLRSGVDGVAVGGMASEAFALTATERDTILSDVVDVVSTSIPVVAGVNATSTVTAVEQAVAARDRGAAALMVLPPYMVKLTLAQVVDFYGDVASATGSEVMVQDAPAVTGVAMAPDLIAQLALVDGVTSVKVEAPPTAPKVAAVRQAVPDPAFAVLGGQNAQFLLDELDAGAEGTMPACEFPDLLAPVLSQWHEGSRQHAREAFTALLPLLVAGLQSGFAWAVHKEVLVARGLIDHATVRSPARPLTPHIRRSLFEVVETLPMTVSGHAGAVQSSATGRSGSSLRAASRSRGSRGTWGSTRARWATGSPRIVEIVMVAIRR